MRLRKKNNRSLGNRGEELTVDYLIQTGYTIVTRNYQKRYGEIDIIAQHDTQLIFVEVKMRNSPYFDSAQLVTPTKQRKIISVAKAYLAQYGTGTNTCRFDVALIDIHNNEPYITYLANAFSEQGV